MISASLKKLVFKKELSLIKEIVNAVDSQITIQDSDGQFLLGKPIASYSHQFPIQLAGQLLGWVNGDERAAAIASLLENLAHREIEKRTLAQELLSKYKEISLLFNISEKIIDSLDVQEIASLVLDEAKGLLKSESGVLLLIGEGTCRLDGIASFGEDLCFKENIALGEGLLGHIIQTGRGEIINDISSDPRHLGGQEDMTTLICVPLKNKEKVLGAIVLSRPKSLPYSAEDLKLLTTLVCQAAGIISALQHERKLKESRQNDLIFRLSAQIRDSLELGIILETAVSEIYTVLHLDRCLFLWYQTESRHQKIACSHPHLVQPVGGLEIVTEINNPNLSTLKGYYLPQGVGNLADQFQRHETVQINQVETLDDAVTREFLLSKNFLSLLAIPIQTLSGQVGVICCGTSKESRIWNETEVELLRAVTNQLAIALDQAELYEKSRMAAQSAQEKAHQLELTLQELQHAQLRLIQSEKMSGIGQMVAGIAHEINNPVSFIHSNVNYINQYSQELLKLIKLYQQEYPHPTPAIQLEQETIDLDFLSEDLPKLLKSMNMGTGRIRDIVLSLRNFSRLDQAEVKPVDIHEGIDSTLLILGHRLKAQFQFTGVEVIKNYGTLPLVKCYPSQLNQVFMNLLANAIDALEERKKPSNWIRISTECTDAETVVIRIADNALGIPEHVIEKLFDPFFTTKPVGKGTGLGLSISSQIITERHGGKLRCESTLNQGTEFIIEIPIQPSLEETP
ncbi:MAG: GAF domain-containing protein [Timaviella obliquedivisa GSE-PSE-MK23-08B]|jgi:signal transduction histidine kinase|nr:GAF domain-containing protein [Timaviella obliquedivisa GSE-PSE-MK23-08B]